MKEKEKPHYYGHRQRLRERFVKEPSLVSDYELLELIIGYVIPRRDVKPLAKELLSKSGSLTELLFYEISEIKGVGVQLETFLLALREYSNRCLKEEVKKRSKKFNTPKSVYNFFKYDIAFGSKEFFAVLYLDSKLQLIKHEIMSKGTVDSAVVFPREVAESALRACANFVVIVHNHPSGCLDVSKEDIVVTKRIKNALAALDITLSDHVIVSKQRYVSLKELALI